MKSINEKTTACEWDVDANEAERMLFEASAFMSDIINECERVHNEVVLRYDNNEFLPLTMQEEFIRVCILFVLDIVKSACAEIKRCNDIGRSVLLKNVKYLGSVLTRW